MIALDQNAALVYVALATVVPASLAAIFGYLTSRRAKQVNEKLESPNQLTIGEAVDKLAHQVDRLDDRAEDHFELLADHIENGIQTTERLVPTSPDPVTRREITKLMDRQRWTLEHAREMEMLRRRGRLREQAEEK